MAGLTSSWRSSMLTAAHFSTQPYSAVLLLTKEEVLQLTLPETLMSRAIHSSPSLKPRMTARLRRRYFTQFLMVVLALKGKRLLWTLRAAFTLQDWLEQISKPHREHSRIRTKVQMTRS